MPRQKLLTMIEARVLAVARRSGPVGAWDVQKLTEGTYEPMGNRSAYRAMRVLEARGFLERCESFREGSRGYVARYRVTMAGVEALDDVRELLA